MRDKIVAMTDNANRSYSIEKEVLERIGGELTVSECKDPKEIIELCKEANGIITEYAPITAEVVENLRKCRVISRARGRGTTTWMWAHAPGRASM